MQKKYVRQIYCICMIAVFLIGISGQKNHLQTDSLHMQSKTQSMSVPSMTSYLSVGTLAGIDDFQITTNAGRTIPGSFAGMRGAAVWLAALILLCFFGSIPPKRRICFRKKRIPIFRIVTFIHRTDGKKKSCFDNQNHIKTGGLTWRLVQSIRFCL